MDDTSLPADRSQPASHPTELCIAQAEDLLGYIPHSMGEWPTESLVAVTVGAGTVGITVRVDLPSRDEDSEAFAAAVCDYLETDALAEAALLVIYTAQPWNDVSAPPRDALVGAVRSALADRGLPVLDAWLVGESHWRSLLCPRISCCPWPGQPIGTILASRLGTELVYRGSTFEPPPASRMASRNASRKKLGPETAVAARSHGNAVEAALLARYRDDPHAWWDPRDFAAALAAWDDSLGDPRAPHPERLALLAATLVRPALRDAVLVAAARGGRAAWRGTLALGALERGPERGDGVSRGGDGDSGACGQERSTGPAAGRLPIHRIDALPDLPGGLPSADVRCVLESWVEAAEPVPGPVAADGQGGHDRRAVGEPSESASEEALAFGAVLLGGTREAPDWDRVARLERLARSMTAMEAPEVRAPALALLGWVCWVRGRGTKAAAYLRRSLTVVPGYRFSELFARVVESGEVAGWARRPETAWRRLGDVA